MQIELLENRIKKKVDLEFASLAPEFALPGTEISIPPAEYSYGTSDFSEDEEDPMTAIGIAKGLLRLMLLGAWVLMIFAAPMKKGEADVVTPSGIENDNAWGVEVLPEVDEISESDASDILMEIFEGSIVESTVAETQADSVPAETGDVRESSESVSESETTAERTSGMAVETDAVQGESTSESEALTIEETEESGEAQSIQEDVYSIEELESLWEAEFHEEEAEPANEEVTAGTEAQSSEPAASESASVSGSETTSETVTETVSEAPAGSGTEASSETESTWGPTEGTTGSIGG